ncbi:transcriptional regulator [Leadbettera azotonutricia]|uniref:Transcriptional regulator n=1 Tax=Leadbettera azotonutricia (strain ATCC BAA-888 / DSM 13862 / ZAS-9) TaxID=545695 RepID=F5Y8B3_LEAAZ|nr:transcriptional regulator [Leadbettera azotonutricia]AEF82606.1 transcriptional regulator [Leadbettera azotonutricia ZAS-9]
MSDEKRVGGNPDYSQAAEDFNRARNKALLSRIQNFLNAEKDELLSFYDVKDILKPKNEFYRGMQQVPIKLIVGSEGRYRDFNKYFLPRSEFLRARWERVDRAQIRDVPLPAIELYEIGGAYFVRDGNHRVSVARAQGVEEIDAEVISLSSEIAITPNMTTDDLRGAVIDYEKKLFYEKTKYGELTGDTDLSFTMPGRYDEIYNHILVHKYFLNEKVSGEIAMEEALISWYREVYSPIIKIINEHRICNNFPGRSPSDLYVWIVKHWDFLKKKNGVHYSVADAARDFAVRYGKDKSPFHRFLGKALGRFFRKRT